MKTALVTGAARGIGRAVAQALSKSGLRVLRLDRQFSEPGEGEAVHFDLMHVEGIAALIDRLGRIDILVNHPRRVEGHGGAPLRPLRQHGLSGRHPRSTRSARDGRKKRPRPCAR